MKKKVLIIVGIILLVGIIGYIALPNKVAVLGYHGLIEENDESNDMLINVDKFEKEMKYLKNMGYDSLTLEDMECYMNKKCKIKQHSVLITFDDGYISNYKLAFPILKKYNLNAVVFIIGSSVDNEAEGFFTKEYIEKTKKEYPNIEFASHSYNLHEEGAINNTYEYFLDDFKKQSKVINTKYMAYPYGKYNDDLIKAMKDSGYKLGFGFGYNSEFEKADNKDNKYVIPRLSIESSMPLWKFKLRVLMPF